MAGAAARLYVDIEANVAGAIAGMKATDAQLKKTAATARATSSTMKASSVGYTMVGTSATRANKQITGTAPAMERSAKATKSMAKESGALRGSMQGMGMGMTAAQGGAFALAYGLGKSVQSAANFDSGMRNVNSIARLSETRFQSLKAQVLDMAGPTAQAPETLAAGMYQLVSSGFKANDAVKVLGQSAIAASAGLTDAETATTAIAGALNAYGLKANKAQMVSDLLFTTVDKGVLSFQDLAQGLGPVLPFATKLGVDLKQVGAMLSILTIKGVPAAEAMTYTKGVMAQMVKPTTDLRREMKKLGVDSGAGLVQKFGSLQGGLEALYKSVGGNTQAFSKLFPDVRGLSAAFTVTGEGARGAATMLDQFNVKAGRTQEVFKEQQKGQGFVFKQLSADVKRAAVDIGNTLAPELKVAGDATHTLAEATHKYKSQIGSVVKGSFKNLLPGAREVQMAQNAMKAIGGAKSLLGGGKKEQKVNVKVTPKVTKMPSLKSLVTGNKVEQLVTLKADNSDVKQKVSQSNSLLALVKGKSAKINVSSNAPQVTSSTQQAINAVTGKTVRINVVTTRSGGNADTVVNGGRLPGRAMGGKAPMGNVAMVGEQGPELVELPNGSYVNTAAKTRSLLAAGIPGYAKGGKVSSKTRKRRAKLRDRADRYGQGKLDTLDFQESTGSISTAKSISTLESLLKSKKFKKASASTKRSAKSKLYDLKTTQASSIKDLQDQAAAVGADPITAAQIAQKTASRHLAEARKTKNAEKIAQAQLEVAEANNELLEAQKAAQEAQVEAQRAQTAAIEELTKAITTQNNMAASNKGITKNTLRSALADLTNDDLGGIFGQRYQTTSRRQSAYVPS